MRIGRSLTCGSVAAGSDSTAGTSPAVSDAVTGAFDVFSGETRVCVSHCGCRTAILAEERPQQPAWLARVAHVNATTTTSPKPSALRMAVSRAPDGTGPAPLRCRA